MKKNKLYFLLVLILMLILNCKQPIRFGQKPKAIYNDMIYKKGEIYLGDNKIPVRYVISNVTKDKSNDIIFYFHGLGRSEFEWVEENGFGSIYADILKQNPKFKNNTVVAISLGAGFFFLNDAPPPYNYDLEKAFIKEIIPYFKKELNINGKIYLIGHSMGGFNVLTLSLRNPDIFPVVMAISPYVATTSPFSPEFDEMGKKLNLPKFRLNILKKQLLMAFENEDKWNEYNPYELIKNSKTKKYPYIIITRASEDLPGFNETISDFVSVLKKYNVPYNHCESKGDHHSVCQHAFYVFLNQISK